MSVTSLAAYQRCPREWYFRHECRLPKRTDYARLCGIAVHQHIAQLYNPVAEPRPFFFKEKASAIGAWIARWERTLETAYEERAITARDGKQEERYQGVGIACIANYWDANVNAPRPLEIETSYEYRLENGDTFGGRLDQLRSVSLPYIARYRPGLVSNGALAEGYDPVVILDLKTDYETFGPEAFRENPSLKQLVRKQFKLHFGLQATAYSFLYEATKGKRPIGFVWYHLRSGHCFFTYRTESDYVALFEVAGFAAENIRANSFPPHSGDWCARCDYQEPCWGPRPFFLSSPQPLPEHPASLLLVPNLIKKDPNRQLRLPFRRATRIGTPPIVPVQSESAESEKKDAEPVLRNLPWDTATAPGNPREMLPPKLKGS